MKAEQAAYNRSLGIKELNTRHRENLKAGGQRFLKGFDPRTRGGGFFWLSAALETVSNILLEQDQRKLLIDAIDPESAAKARLGVYAERV